MYCRNCGKELDSKATVCTSCGVIPGGGNKYCQNCGSPTDINAVVCVKCGTRLMSSGEGRDWTIALILSVLVGQFGIDRFYTGYIGLGILKLLTAGGCGIWWLIDVILIATGKYRDSDGNLLVRK
ncbi:MAG: TM2 domain-containing protein [Candidatus Omnitrophica bacterium]|nr:TM2 domain-containing protein [Candidatus Omnitrophota bacterium]